MEPEREQQQVGDFVERFAAAMVAWRGVPPIKPGFVPACLAFAACQTISTMALSKALKKQGFAFVGPTTMHALLQAIGLIDDHLVDCHRRGAGSRATGA